MRPISAFTPLVSRAAHFAAAAHRGQLRKYTNEPYFVHAAAVAERLMWLGKPAAVVAAAYLHDTLEDTDTTYADLVREFGHEVAVLVSEVTDVSTFADGNRAARKHKDLLHLADASAAAQVIKLADIEHNAKSIEENDPGFSKVWIVEKAALLKVLTKASL